MGINTTNPAAQLDVAGRVRFTEDLAFNAMTSSPSHNPAVGYDANKARIWAQKGVFSDTGGGSFNTGDFAEMRVMDGHGYVTTISPHNFKSYKPSPDDYAPWSYRSHNIYTGREINVDMSGAIRALEELSGRQFIYAEDLPAEDIISYEAWKSRSIANNIKQEKQKLLAANPVVEITIADAWEEIDEMVPSTVTKYRMNWETMQKETYIDADFSNMQPTGKKLRQFKESVYLDENNGKFYRERTINEIDLSQDKIGKINNIDLPQHIKDRLPR